MRAIRNFMNIKLMLYARETDRAPEEWFARPGGNDGPKARAEFLNAWREDLSDFLPLDVIEACAEWGVCCGHRNVTPA